MSQNGLPPPRPLKMHEPRENVDTFLAEHVRQDGRRGQYASFLLIFSEKLNIGVEIWTGQKWVNFTDFSKNAPHFWAIFGHFWGAPIGGQKSTRMLPTTVVFTFY